MVSRLLREKVDKKRVKPNHWGFCKGLWLLALARSSRKDSRHWRGKLKSSQVSAGPVPSCHMPPNKTLNTRKTFPDGDERNYHNPRTGRSFQTNANKSSILRLATALNAHPICQPGKCGHSAGRGWVQWSS